MTGEEQNLAPRGFGAQKVQCCGAARLVEIGQGIVQNEGDLFVGGQHQLGNGQTQGQIKLVGGTLAQQGGTAGNGSCIFRCRVQCAVQEYMLIASAGKGVEDLAGPAAQYRRKTGLQVGIGPVKLLQGQGQSIIFFLCLAAGGFQ